MNPIVKQELERAILIEKEKREKKKQEENERARENVTVVEAIGEEHSNPLLKGKVLVVLSGMIWGFVIFVLIYGTKILDVTFDDWIMNNGGDFLQHYIGWLYYRKTPWKFPIGLIDGLLEDSLVSVTFMDSIPLFAVFFKLLSPVLPATFQYFGLYGIIVYMLQGALSGLIIYKLTKSIYAGIISPALFVTNTVLTTRMYAHTALACHPIILMALLLAIDLEKLKERKKDLLCWLLLMFMASWIHLYFVPMVAIIMIGAYLKDIISKKWYVPLIKMGTVFAFTLIMMYVMGDFYGETSLAESDFGVYNYNLISFFEPAGASRFFEFVGTVDKGRGETFAYLGVGIIIMMNYAIISILVSGNLKEKIKQNIGWIFTVIVLSFISIIPSIRIGNYNSKAIKLPKVTLKVMTMFRANCRFIWPVMYIVVILSICTLLKKHNKRGIVLFYVLCIVQLADLSNIVTIKKEESHSMIYGEPHCLQSSVWNEMNVTDIYFTGNMGDFVVNNEFDKVMELGIYAADNDLKMNDFYVARKNNDIINEKKQKELELLLAGEAKDGRLYVFNEIPADLVLNAEGINIYIIDSIIIGTTAELKNEEKLTDITLIDKNLVYVTDGSLNEYDCTVNTGAVQYGPYFTLSEGAYHAEYIGEDIENCIYEVTAGKEHEKCEITNFEVTNEGISFDFEIEERMDDVEIKCINNSEEAIVIDEIVLSQD